MKSKYKLTGFTLIEVMITVAIVAILAAIALPAYDNYIKKSRRSDAMSSLLKVQLEQEKWRASNVSYTSTITDLGFAAGASNSLEGYYTIAKDTNITVSGTAYQFKATPAGVQAGDTAASGGCGIFAVDQQGPEYTAGDAEADKTCWQR